MLQQLRLIPSGVQAWHKDTIAASADAFAYCSTMAIHVFKLKDNALHKMIAAHERAISAVCWNPQDSNLIASCSIGNRMAIWDIENEEELYSAKAPDVPLFLDWAPAGDKLAVGSDTGEIKLWEYKADKLTKIFSVEKNGVKVLRWHPRTATRLLIGVVDGSLWVYDTQTNKKLHIIGKAKTSKDPVTDAQWDPLSEDYLLAAFQDGSLTLYDASTQQEIHSFDKQTQGIRSLAWAKAQPGNFVTVTDRVGILRLWNVSQRAPLAQVKVGPTGVNCIKAVPGEPNWFVLSFKNSAVGVCDIATRTMRFMSATGHSETIFDVTFHPEDPDIIGTASYDGTVKLWKLSSGESYREMTAGKDNLLYGLAFGPGAARVCAVSSVGVLFIWRTDTGEQVIRQQLHTGQAYRVEWNRTSRTAGGGEIATGGADGVACVVDAASGNILKRIPHPGPVIGVCWHGQTEGVLATGCQDGVVRVFDLMQSILHGGEPKALVNLQGHEAKVFNVVFHPMLPSILASGSDDRTVRIWNWSPGFTGQRELRRLTGHTAFVRGLTWHSELPHILFSGSWDASIRVWDVAASRCLHVSREHNADVYGVALHPQRPFFLVSSSRDTTLRFWIFEDLVRPLLVQALLRPEKFSDLLGSSHQEVTAAFEAAPAAVPLRIKLYGAASRALASTLQSLGTQRPIPLQVYEKIGAFFLYRQGIEDLWGLLATIRGEHVVPRGLQGAARSAFHEKELIACQKSKALELASTRVAIGVTGKLEERLLKAAQILLRVGDLRGYCRFTAQAGHWERAICVAPAVSVLFWQELCTEYIESLSATTDVEEAAPFWAAIGKSGKLVDSYIERGELDNAFVVAKAASDGLFPEAVPLSAPQAATSSSDSARSRLEDVAAVLAARYADQGEPLQAAMCFLAVSKSARAVHTLWRSHEAILAYIVAELLGQPKDPTLVKLLAQCAERDQRFEAAAEMWQKHPQGPTLHLHLLAHRCPNKDLSQMLSTVTVEQHKAQSQAALASGDIPAAVLSAVCAGDYAQAAELAVNALLELFGRPSGWTVAEARQLLDPLESVPLQDMSVKDIASTLTCASYVGLVEATMLGFHELMFPLAQTLRNIITHQGLAFPVTMTEISLLEATGTSHRAPAHALQQLMNLLQSPDLPPHLRPVCEQQIVAIQSRGPSDDWSSSECPGLGKLAGGALPACYKRWAQTSVLTNQLIRGPAFLLEDQKLHISLSDALAWTRVNAFSPLNTGCKIFPV